MTTQPLPVDSAAELPHPHVRTIKQPVVSVIIPTKNRPELLRRCIRAVLEQTTAVDFEVVVVNDAGCPLNEVFVRDPRVRIVDGPSRGPAAARNVGLATASGEIILFTDDDAIPQSGWLDAASGTLLRHADAVGVVGRVVAPAYDHLYEHAVANDGGVGNFLTCNVAYRRQILLELGGFDTGFQYPHAEDRDLGYRMQQIGKVLFEPAMLVVHPARPVTARDVIRRGRFVESDWRLFLKHPHTRTPRWSTRWGPFVRVLRRWQRLLAQERAVGLSAQRAARFAALAGGQTAVALWTTTRGGKLRLTGPAGESPASARGGLRIAWIGAPPEAGGGVAGVGWLILKGLSELGCQVDCYLSGSAEVELPMASLPGVRTITLDTGWRYDQWYSRHRVTKTFTGFAARAWGRYHEASLLLEQHPLVHYDVVYQFSTIEVFGLRRHLGSLPPLVIHPETHIAGELRWVRRERRLAARCEPAWRRTAVEALLTFRSKRQARDIHLADRVIAISKKFGQHLVDDYGVSPSVVTVVPNPIDVDELVPKRGRVGEPGPWRIAFVGRISARKGVDLIVDLSHRLADMAGQVSLDLIGADTLWSDYRPLLSDLNSTIARYHGPMTRTDLLKFLERSDLLIQPAKFEPFGLTVGEALAKGVPVVVTDEVGAGEGVDERCCTVVDACDVDALEEAVRGMLRRLSQGEGLAISRLARSEAERLFHPRLVAKRVLDVLEMARASSSSC